MKPVQKTEIHLGSFHCKIHVKQVVLNMEINLSEEITKLCLRMEMQNT